MHLDKKFLQRAFLAFTTGLFLACAARISTANAGEIVHGPRPALHSASSAVHGRPITDH